MTSEKLNRMEEFIINAEGNITHVKRVLHIAKLLAEKEKIPYDDDILTFASYFHDIAAYPPFAPSGSFDHADESGKLVPEIAREFGYNDDQIEIIVEAVVNHNKPGTGKHNETLLIRNADGIDYLGCVAVARDFVKYPKDMKKAVETMKKRKETFGPLADLRSAKEIAALRISELDAFIERFEQESFGIY